MISRTTFCSAQASTIRLARTGPMPSTSRRRSGSASITSNTFSPNARTSFFAYAGPMPRIIPEARYFTIPSSDVGAEVFRKRARNCCPCARSLTHSPDAVIHSPAEIDAAWPTTVTRSRCPRALVRSTQNPFSALWNVTRSTRPARTSCAEAKESEFICSRSTVLAPFSAMADGAANGLSTGRRVRIGQATCLPASLGNGKDRPLAALRDRPYGRAVSVRKRSSA